MHPELSRVKEELIGLRTLLELSRIKNSGIVYGHATLELCPISSDLGS